MRTLFTSLSVGSLLWVGCVLSLLGRRVDYDLAVDCARLPADDGALAAWLGGQPGVREPVVWRERDTLRVQFQRLETLWVGGYYAPPYRDLGYVPARVSWRQATPAAQALALLGNLRHEPAHLWCLAGCLVAGLLLTAAAPRKWRPSGEGRIRRHEAVHPAAP